MSPRRALLLAGLAVLCVTSAAGSPSGHRLSQPTLPHVPGYIPVYIQSGDSPPDVERLYESQRTLPQRAAPSNKPAIQDELRAAPSSPQNSRRVPPPGAGVGVLEAAPPRARPQASQAPQAPHDDVRGPATRTRSPPSAVPGAVSVPLQDAPTPSRRAPTREVPVKDNSAPASSRVTKRGGAGPAPGPAATSLPQEAPLAGGAQADQSETPSKPNAKKRTGSSNFRGSQQYKPEKLQQQQQQQNRAHHQQHQRAAQTRKRQQQQRGFKQQPPQQHEQQQAYLQR